MASTPFGTPMLMSRAAKVDQQRYDSLADFAADYGPHTVEHEYARRLFAAGYKQVVVGRLDQDPWPPSGAIATTGGAVSSDAYALGQRVRVDDHVPQFGGLTGAIVGREGEQWHVRLDRWPSETRAWSGGYLIPLETTAATNSTVPTRPFTL